MKGLFFLCIFEYIFFCKFICQFPIIRSSKMNWNIHLWWIFHISPYYKFFKMIHSYEIRSFHSSYLSLPFSYFFSEIWKTWWFSRYTPPRGDNWERYFILCLCNSISFVITVYLRNFNFLWVRNGYSKSVPRNFCKDTAIFVKQLYLKYGIMAKSAIH